MEKIKQQLNWNQFLEKVSEHKGKFVAYKDNINATQLKRDLVLYINDNKFIILFEDGKYKIKNGKYIVNYQNYDSFTYIINNFLKFKIKDYQLSSNIFGYKKTKKEMFESNKQYEIENFYEDFTCKKDNVVRNIVEIFNGEKVLKFVLDDIEIIYPDIDKLLKGFQPKKDRTIRRLSTVAFKRKDIDRNIYKVKKIEKVGAKQFCHIECNEVKLIKNIKELKLV